MNNVRIRDMRADDAQDLLVLNEANLPHVSSVSHSDIESFRRQACYFRVAETDGTMAGFLLAFSPAADYGSPNFLWFKQRYASFVYIDRIIVAPHARKMGIATCLYADLECFALGQGVPLLTCEYNIFPSNEASHLFHLKYGFEEVGTQKTTGGRKTVSLQVRQVDRALLNSPLTDMGPRHRRVKPMDLILVTDIYGYTPHAAAIVDELSCFFSGTAVVDPYEGRHLDFKSEQEAYEHFQEICGIDKLIKMVERTLLSGGNSVVAVGFSVGATALWNITGMDVSHRIDKAVCFYGSRIREKTYVEPCCETIVVFPRHEDQHDVESLHDMISGRKNVTCIKTGYLHGYMNQLSKNFDKEGYRTCMGRLKHCAGA